jgi:integrase
LLTVIAGSQLPVRAPAMVGGAPPAPAELGHSVVMVLGSAGTARTASAIGRDLLLTAAHFVQPGADYKLVGSAPGQPPVLKAVIRIESHPQFVLRQPHCRRPQEAAERLQISENTLKAAESGQHETARKCCTLLPMCCPAFCRVHVLSAPDTGGGGGREHDSCHLRKDVPMKLSKANVSKITLPPGKDDHTEWDDDIPGFGLRIRSGGSATWIFQYRQGSKQRKLTLGSASAISAHDARKRASELHAKVRLGQDPAGEKIESRTRAVETLGSILKPFLSVKKAALKPRSYEQVERHLLVHSKRLHPLQTTAIDRRAIATLLTELSSNNGAGLANSVRASLSAFFSWAMREGLADSNPVIGSNKAETTKARDRVLTNDELHLMWNALPDNDYGDIVRLLALTGQRRDEIGSLRWREIDFDKAVISLPAERTKNSKPHDIPLSDAALAILQARPHRVGRDLVFGTGANGYLGWSSYKLSLDARIADKGTIPPWRLHDLRRTAATRMADELGVQPHIIEAVLNHVSGHKAGVAGIYNRATYEKEKRQALNIWGEHLGAVVSGECGKVVVMPKARPPR